MLVNCLISYMCAFFIIPGKIICYCISSIFSFIKPVQTFIQLLSA